MLNPMRDKNEAMIVFGGGEKTPASRAMVELVQNSAPVSRADGKILTTMVELETKDDG